MILQNLGGTMKAGALCCAVEVDRRQADPAMGLLRGAAGSPHARGVHQPAAPRKTILQCSLLPCTPPFPRHACLCLRLRLWFDSCKSSIRRSREGGCTSSVLEEGVGGGVGRGMWQRGNGSLHARGRVGGEGVAVGRSMASAGQRRGQGEEAFKGRYEIQEAGHLGSTKGRHELVAGHERAGT